MTTSQIINHDKKEEQRRNYEAQLLKQVIQQCFAEQSKRLGERK